MNEIFGGAHFGQVGGRFEADMDFAQKSVDVLVSALAERDGFLRFKAVGALERLRRTDTPLTFAREPLRSSAGGRCRDWRSG